MNDFPPIDVAVLQTLFDLTPVVAFFIKDAGGRYVAVNDSLVLRHGLTKKSDAIGKRPQDICSGEFGRTPSEQDAQVLRTGKPIIDHLELQLHRPRAPIWCLTTKFPIRGMNGAIIGIIGFSRDVRVPMERSDIPEGLAAALEMFELDLSREVTPAWLARRAQISSQRLSRLFKRIFGVTPSQFIIKTRIAAASRLLHDTDRSVAAIAHASGFYDQSAFARAFRSATGLTPMEYRNRSRLKT